MTDSPKSKQARRYARMTNTDPTPAADAALQVEQPVASSSSKASVSPTSKAARIVSLMQREEGATLAEMVEATGWLPHTTRAAMTGLRKKGYSIERTRRGEQTCYFSTTGQA